jgi:hypothetical protein
VFTICFLNHPFAQLKPKTECQEIVVDIYKGWVNELKPNADPEQLKVKLPCFTLFEKEGNESKCGGSVCYKDRDFTFYTQRDYYEIGPKFKGKLSVALLGKKRDALFSLFGNPVLKDKSWDAFRMAYGTLVVFYNSANLVNKIIITTKSTDDLQLCE